MSVRRCAVLIVCSCAWFCANAGRVLIVVPTPSFSHQIVFRPIAKELAKRGHRVVFLTTDPEFSPGKSPTNLTEIDLHEVSYAPWIDRLVKTATGDPKDAATQLETAYDLLLEIYAKQMKSDAMQKLLADKNERFDLILAESWTRAALSLSHIYKAKVIWMSSLGGLDENYEVMGAPVNTLVYPDFLRTRIYNLSLWEKVTELYTRYSFYRVRMLYEEKENAMLREVFGVDMPPTRELQNNVEALFVNMDPVFEGYRPVPPNVVHLGSLNCVPPKQLPEDLKLLMDSSKHGVIYMSFGTNTDPSLLPPERMAIFSRVFGQLPYDVVWKWRDPPPGLPANVHTYAWLPQPDLLRHKKVVLFITQAGLQSTDEALRAGVPLLALPMLGDQWYNAEQYMRLGVGQKLELTQLTDHQLKTAIEHIINDPSYRERSKWLGEEMQDNPQSALDRAIWWIERVMRRRGPGFRAPRTPVCWLCIIEGDILMLALALLGGLSLAVYTVYRILTRSINKMKTN